MSLMGLSGLLVVGCGLRKSGTARSMSSMGRLVVVVVVVEVVVVALGAIPMATMEQPLKSAWHSASGFWFRFAQPMYIQMQSTETQGVNWRFKELCLGCVDLISVYYMYRVEHIKGI